MTESRSDFVLSMVFLFGAVVLAASGSAWVSLVFAWLSGGWFCAAVIDAQGRRR